LCCWKFRTNFQPPGVFVFFFSRGVDASYNCRVFHVSNSVHLSGARARTFQKKFSFLFAVSRLFESAFSYQIDSFQLFPFLDFLARHLIICFAGVPPMTFKVKAFFRGVRPTLLVGCCGLVRAAARTSSSFTRTIPPPNRNFPPCDLFTASFPQVNLAFSWERTIFLQEPISG